MNTPNILDGVKIWKIRRPLKDFDFLGCQQSYSYQIVDNERIGILASRGAGRNVTELRGVAETACQFTISFPTY
uniref:Uncharacterized protein n=1 Tax=Caenorhabditis japonica TaxID=281687 RepID=A0A8R1IC56_CAEJA